MAIKRKRNSKSNEDSKVHLLAGTSSLANLPCEIVTKILIKLPVKSVFNCKRVCKSWNSIISDPHFTQLHLECTPSVLLRTHNYRRVSRTLHLLDFDELKSNEESQNLPSEDDDDDSGQICSCKDSPKLNCGNHTKFKFKLKLPLRDSKMVIDTMLKARTRRSDDVVKLAYNDIISCKPRDHKFDVVNSCNGLLCLCDLRMYTRLVICNPVTGEFMRFPLSENDKLMLRSFHAGFGYLKKTNEYKVIRLYQRHAEVHTLGTRLWRNMEHHVSSHWRRIRYPTFLNGSIHWLAYSCSNDVSVLSFDLESEKLNSFPCPSAVSPIRSHISFGELYGSLYICCQSGNAKCLRFWRMKKDGDRDGDGDGRFWTQVLGFNIKVLDFWSHLCRPIFLFVRSGILIHDASRFVYYDPQKHLFTFLEGRGTSFKFEPISHIPSLIKLKDAIKGDNIEVLNVHSRCAAFKLQEEEEEVLYMAKYKADRKDMTMDFLNL